MLDDATLSAELTRVTAGCEQVEPGVLRAVIQSEPVPFRLFVRRAGGYVRLEVTPFLQSPDDPAQRAALYRELLIRTRTLMEARFAVGDDGEPVLEALVDEKSPVDSLHAALDALVAAMQTHYPVLNARYRK
jgi:hypothetical protein